MKFKKLIKNIKSRKKFKKTEIITLINKQLKKKNNLYLINLCNYYFSNKINQVNKNSIRNCCILTGYSRFIFKKWRLSRFQIKKLIKLKYIFSCKNTSW